MEKYLLFIFLSALLGNPIQGFNYTEFFLERNPYLAREVIEEYSNFSDQVNSALGLPHENQNIRGHAAGSNLESGNSTENSKSAVGIASIMALLNENIWGRVRAPGFEHVSPRLRKDSLPELMGTLFKAAEQDYNTKIRNVIFTPTWIKSGINMANLKGEIKQTYFQFPEKAMEIVNDLIRRRFGNSANFPDYLTESLPDTTQAMLLSSKEQRGHWPSFTDYAGSSNFRSGSRAHSAPDPVEMFEIRGNFRFWKNEQFQFVTVPLSETKLQVTLVLPNETSPGMTPDWDELTARNVTEDEYQMLRLRLPVKTFLTRNSIRIENTTQCEKDSSQSAPCLKLLDAVTYTSFSPTEFQFIELTGGYINNPYLTHFKVKGSNIFKSSVPPLESWRWFLPPRKHLRTRNTYPGNWSWLSHFKRGPYSSYDFNESNFSEERIMIFDQPFYWFVRGSI
ncbi:unnamed protein product [Allacma fusca]|uniref:Uncharacterized protein n=1 Tax=Allacma fusca TaxID=39272 RepID=A0A8J2JV65_9HEXA|nr:unnamed protein product [Allacma fusca]